MVSNRNKTTKDHREFCSREWSATGLIPSVTGGKTSYTGGYDQLRSPATSKCSVVFGSLLEVADERAMEIAEMGLVFADLGPLYDQMVVEWWFSLVFNQSFTVGKCRTMVFSSRRNVSMVFSSPRPLIISDWSATSITNHSPTSGQQLVQIGGISKDLS